jgi:ferredoxin
MAKLTHKKTGKSIEVEDGNYIRRAAEELGVPFCCNIGRCGACIIDILEGEENLSELTEEEKEMGMNKKQRLACQCRIKSGEVVIDF